MKAKFSVGDKVYCKKYDSSGVVLKVLYFFTEKEIIYKVRLGGNDYVVSSDILESLNG